MLSKDTDSAKNNNDNPKAICDTKIQIPRFVFGFFAARNTAPVAPPTPLNEDADIEDHTSAPK